MLFKELSLEYQKLNRATPSNRERWQVRSAIAETINSGQVDKDWYLDNHLLRLLNYQSIDQLINQKRQPSLSESIVTTEVLDKKYQELMETFFPQARSIVRIGSSTWAKNFYVKGFGTEKSDLDIEVIIDDIDPSIGIGFPGLESGLQRFLKLYHEGRADYYSYGYKSQGIPISIHFMPSNTFKKNCDLDCTRISSDFRNIEFRTKPKSKPPIYDERYDGHGNEYVFHAHPQKIKEGFLTEVPVMMVGEYDQIIMGLIMSKYFTFPIVEGDSLFFQKNIKKFKTSLNQRLFIEGDGKFINMPAKKSLMPSYVLKQLDAEQEKLRRSCQRIQK